MADWREETTFMPGMETEEVIMISGSGVWSDSLVVFFILARAQSSLRAFAASAPAACGGQRGWIVHEVGSWRNAGANGTCFVR